MRKIRLVLLLIIGILLFSWAKQKILPGSDQTKSGELEAVKIDSATLLVFERFPMKASLALRGELPSACHALVWEIFGPNEKNIIEVTTYAESQPEKFCIQVLAPFEVQIPLGNFADLEFRVRLNGEDLGDL